MKKAYIPDIRTRLDLLVEFLIAFTLLSWGLLPWSLYSPWYFVACVAASATTWVCLKEAFRRHGLRNQRTQS